MGRALLSVCGATIAVVLVGCSPNPTVSPTATPVDSAPTPAASAVEPTGSSLLQRAEAFALARTEARFDDAYAFASPSFRQACGSDSWLFGLIGEASFWRGFNNLDDDHPLEWRVRLVEESEGTGTVAVSVSTQEGRGLEIYTRRWSNIDGVWWFDDPPENVCL